MGKRAVSDAREDAGMYFSDQVEGHSANEEKSTWFTKSWNTTLASVPSSEVLPRLL